MRPEKKKAGSPKTSRPMESPSYPIKGNQRFLSDYRSVGRLYSVTVMRSTCRLPVKILLLSSVSTVRIEKNSKP